MRQHSNLAKDPAEKVVKDTRRATRKQYSAEEKILIVWKACAARTASPSCAAARVSRRTCTIAGRRTSWRLERSAWPVTRLVPQLRSLGLSPAQGPRPDHQPGLHHDEGRGRVQEQDDCAEPALADRLRLPEGDWLGLVLSVPILDDFSRYIIAWKLCTTMKAEDVTDTLKLALQASGLEQATVMHRPRLLSDNGSSYVSGDLAKWLERQDMRHTLGAPYHPMTQGKIERWHQTLKNRILLENYYLPGDLEAQIDAFVAYYNHRRYHESIDNLTPADVYFGRGQTILLERERIKRKTIQNRRLLHHKQAA